MILEQIVLESLGHASYLVASEQTGEALVLDPRRDVAPYLERAQRHGLRIAYVMDSHQHNDYVSGILELAAHTGAQVLAGATSEVGYEHRPVKDGERIAMGEVVLEAIHTPGHTPEHMSLVVYDGGGDEPAILLSGGALLVGDLARPDLLGGPEKTRAAAKTFCGTLQEKILTLPDHVLVYPTHVSGSLCGGNIGSRTTTTVGYERRTNPILAGVAARDVFVEECLKMDSLPAVPPYWPRMRRTNTEGPAVLGEVTPPPAVRVDQLEELVERGAIVLDVRTYQAFGGGHIPGALNVGASTAFPTWAGTVLPTDRDVVVVVDRQEDLEDVTWSLLRIGYDAPRGWLAGGMQAWSAAGKDVALLPQISVDELAKRTGELTVLDVRQPAEWSAGHIEGALFVTGAEVPARIGEIPEGPLAVTCGSGYRSSVVASYLLHRGRDVVINVAGGMGAWNARGMPTVSGD